MFRRTGFWVGAAILVANLAFIAIYLITQLTAINDNFTRFVASDSEDHTVTETGTQYIFIETNGTVDGRFIAVPDGFAGVDINVTSPGGKELKVSEPGATLTYEFKGSSGRAIAQFDAEKTGLYEVDVVTADSNQEAIIAVGPFPLIRTILTVVGVAFILGAAGIGVIVVTWLRHR